MVTAPNGAGTSEHFKLEDFPLGSKRPMRVAVIGTGFAGLTATIRLSQRLQNIELVTYEKNGSVGGTWFENDYPGLCCDIPAHTYQLTFHVKPTWSKFYAPGPEILAYLKEVAKKWKLDRYIKYHSKLVKTEWNEETGMWKMWFDKVDDEGNKVGEFTDEAHAVMQCLGGLSRWSWPNIPGLQDFKGTKIHSAHYIEKAEDSKDKNVAVIGVGSSAIQIVPNLQPHAKRVDNYVRGQTWIAAPFASKELFKRQPDGRNYVFTEEEKKEFSADPVAYQKFRYGMEQELNAVHAATMVGSDMQNGAVEAFKQDMQKRLSKKPEIADKLIPTFPVACRRLTPGPGYLEALCEDNVNFVSEGIKTITATGIETVDGEHREYDTIVCATGFDTSFMPRHAIVGRGGVTVQDKWAEFPKHYMSMAIDSEFPNYFVVNGPNSSLGSGSLLVMFEREVDYVVQCIDKMQREHIKAMAPKHDAVVDFMEYVKTYFPKTVYGQPCRSWYKAGKEIGPVVGLWPGSCLHAIHAMRHPRWEDYEYVQTKPGNRFVWFGNGWSVEEAEGGDTAFYLNEIDWPPVPE